MKADKKRDSFGILIETCRKSIKYDPWTTDVGMEGYCQELINEMNELKTSLKKNDEANISEELGDVLIDWVHLSLLAEERHKVKIRIIIDEAIQKLERRKPYMAEGRKVSLQEAREIWRRIKLEEKNMKIR